MMEVLIILLAISIIGIFLFVVYMNHLNELIDKLETKIGTLQYQTDDVLHDIDVVNKNIRNYYGLLRRTEDEKIDAEPNLERLWHDSNEEPKKYPILCKDEKNRVWIDHNLKDYIESWDIYVEFCEIVRWAYISDLLPKGGDI